MQLLRLACAFAGCVAGGTATTYYISPSGSDANPGTSPAQPWLTPGPASALLFAGGDRVLFQGGVVHNLGPAGLVVRRADGVGPPGSPPVVIATYGGGPTAKIIVDASKTSGVLVLNTGAVSVQNLTLAHSGAGKAVHHGIHILSNASDGSGPRWAGVAVAGCSLAGFAYGLLVDSAGGCRGFAGVRVTNVFATGSLRSGIASVGAYSDSCYSHADIEVTESAADDNPGDPSVTNSWSGSGIVLSAVDGAVISHSRASFNGAGNGHLGGGPVGIWFWDTNNGTISHCVSFSNSNGHPPHTSNDGGGFDLDGGTTNSLIQYSFSFNNSGPGFLVCSFGGPRPVANNTIQYSVSLGDGTSSLNGASGFNLYTPDTLANTTLVGNTLVATNGVPVVGTTPSGNPAVGVALDRNVLLALGGGPVAALGTPQTPEAAALSGNEYWATGPWELTWGGVTYTSLQAFRAGTGQEEGPGGAPTGSAADPGVSTAGAFFQSCVQWDPEVYPRIPNSPSMDALRGFSGCG